MTKYRIPVRVSTPSATPLDAAPGNNAASEEPIDVYTQRAETAGEAVSAAAPGSSDKAAEALESTAKHTVRLATQEAAVLKEAPKTAPGKNTRERELSYRSSESEEWKERALQLQADMANYRERQKRIAHEQAQAEQIALLKEVLTVADNLDRALAAAQEKPGRKSDSASLTRGVEMTRAALQRTLAKYGLERFQAEGELFDPAWHEAVHVVPAKLFGVRPDTVVEVLEDGYRRQGVLFRPAKVTVAQ